MVLRIIYVNRYHSHPYGGVVLSLLSENLPKGGQRSGRTLHVTTRDKDFAGNSAAAESGEQWETAACQKQ